MKKKITIITSGHPPFDERIYWKFAHSLKENNFDVLITNSTGEIKQEESGISIIGFNGNKLSKREKTNKFLNIIKNFSPDIIICCEPMTILSAQKYKKHFKKSCKIISDITEWYPENVALKSSGIKKILIYIFLYILNILLTNFTDALIIGETNKKHRYDLIAPFKKKIIIGYYPVLKYFKYNPPQFRGKELTLCYAGLINFSRGILKLLEVGDQLAKRYPEFKIKLKIVGRFESAKEEKEFTDIAKYHEKIIIERVGWIQYPKISDIIGDVDICFDLRENNFIYNNSLPIKIFEYMACGKPFIFSNVKAIRNELGELNCGQIVDQNNIEEIISKVEKYISNKDLLFEHSKNGREIIESGKNWENESRKLISLLEELSGSEHSG